MKKNIVLTIALALFLSIIGGLQNEICAQPIKTTKSQGTIKSIKVDTYPYAEQNFENGFTKVSFNTTRPVDFVVSLSANRASKFPVMDLVRLARLDNLYKENNFDSRFAHCHIQQSVYYTCCR